jgi:ribonucleoside-diphosphate reductase alpha chain
MKQQNNTLNKELQKLKGTQFVDEFSKEIYEQTYCYGKEDINKTFERVAKNLSSIEEDKEYWKNQFQWALEDFKFVPGGRITSNAGTGLKGTSYINCFTPETLVLTSNGYKPIVDVEIGDMVLTHKGRYKPVVSLMRKMHSDKMVNIKSPSLTSDLNSTLEHPFYQGNDEWVQADFINKVYLAKHKENIFQSDEILLDIYQYIKDVTRKGGKKSIIADREYVYSTSEWENPNGGSIISRNKSKTNRHIPLSAEFAYFIGRFIGDGSTFCVNGEYEVDGFNIAFNKKEIDSQIEIKKIIDESFGITCNINDAKDFEGSYIRKNNIVVSNFLLSVCGRYSESKRIPDFIWQSSRKIKIAFIQGLIDADGTITSSEVKIIMNNKSLINNLQALLLLCGIPSNTGVEIVNNKPYYRLSLVRQFSSDLIKTSNKVYSDNRIEEYCDQPNNNSTTYKSKVINETNEVDGQIFFVNIDVEKNEIDYNGFVYNISVLDDESYVVNNVIVHNCFVDGFTGTNQDSMEGILSALRRQALILKSEGGYGFCADVMRPRGGFVDGIGNETPGAVRMLDMWDTQSAVITAGSGQKTKKEKAKIKIRKGAQMVTMSCWHPDIEEFITAKQTPGRLTKFNMSSLITDDFMDAVKNNKPWDLIFPDFDADKKLYDENWDGFINNWIEKGYPIKVYKTFENANILWDLIMQSTYNRNEPGVLFVDVINRLNNLYYCESINSTNPCGEQLLPNGGVCLLGSLNLTQFINFEKQDWDYEKLEKVIPIAIRFMDNVNDITYVPLDSQRENLKNKRRIGLGVMGYGSALMMLKLRYGSMEALELTEKLEDFIANTAYQASSNIAVEKGSFPLFDVDKYLDGNFVKNLSIETIKLIRKQGLRNSHLLSIQPTGNSSIFANVVSGGLEPVFLPIYVRTSMFPYPPNGLYVPKNIDWINKKYDLCDTDWQWIKEGDDNLLKTEFEGYSWKFDRDRGLLRETVVKDYAVRFLEERGEWDITADWAATTTQLTVDEHVDTMGIFAKYVDSAISKTTNLPFEYPYADFKETYMKAYDTGTIKGFTTYRAGTMTEVLGAVDKKDDNGKPLKIVKTTAPKRPKTLPCDIYQVTANGEKWIVLVGIYENDPYEVFAFKPLSEGLHLPVRLKNGYLTKIKKGRYDLQCEGGLNIEDLSQHFETTEQEALTRMISWGLRHGGGVQFAVEQLNKSEGTIVSFAKAIARTLKKYIPEDGNTGEPCPNCGEKSLVYQEGCMVCLQCSASKCG